jgi:hypothetical protein
LNAGRQGLHRLLGVKGVSGTGNVSFRLMGLPASGDSRCGAVLAVSCVATAPDCLEVCIIVSVYITYTSPYNEELPVVGGNVTPFALAGNRSSALSILETLMVELRAPAVARLLATLLVSSATVASVICRECVHVPTH